MRAISLGIALALVGALVGALTAAGQFARVEGMAAFQEGRYSVAMAKLKEAAADPKDRTARVFLALTEAALGDCKTALPGLTASAASMDASLYRLSSLAAVRCYGAVGDESRAQALLSELEKRFPADADVLYTSAKLHMKAFNDATFAMFERAPASYRVHQLSAEIFEIQDRYAEAAGEYRKAIALNPAAPELHFELGRAILLESHGPEALERAGVEFREELKLSPEDAAAEFQLGQIAAAQGKAEDARGHFERAVSLSPRFVQALVALGKLQLQDKRYAAAIDTLARAVAIDPANESAHYGLLTAYRDAGQLEKAKAEMAILERLRKPPEGEFTDFLKRLGEKKADQ